MSRLVVKMLNFFLLADYRYRTPQTRLLRLRRPESRRPPVPGSLRPRTIAQHRRELPNRVQLYDEETDEPRFIPLRYRASL